MIFTQKHIEIVKENWIKASVNLNFKIITPYFIIVNGNAKEVFMFLPEYGSSNGMIVGLDFPLGIETDMGTDKEIRVWAKENNCYCSFINIEAFLSDNHQIYIQDSLDDWMRYKSQ